MAHLSPERMKEIYDSFLGEGGGRPLEELIKTQDALKGAEAQRLRGHFTSYGLHPTDCEDPLFVVALMTGRRADLESKFAEEVKNFGGGEAARKKAITKWEEYRDSPNRLPIFDILQIGAWTFLQQSKSNEISENYFDALEFLLSLPISCTGTDLAGYTALQHSLTCSPLLYSFRWSQILVEASPSPIAAINHRNRFGTTALHEAVMGYKRPGENEIRKQVIEWLLEHGANADISDNDGCSPRSTAAVLGVFKPIIEKFDLQQIEEQSCSFCRRGGIKGKGKQKVGEDTSTDSVQLDKLGVPIKASLRCGQCRSRLYCSKECQKLDWKHHKRNCRPVKTENSV